MKFAVSFMFAVCIQQATCQLGNEPSVSTWATDTPHLLNLQGGGPQDLLASGVDASSQDEIEAAKAVAIVEDKIQKSAGADASMGKASSILEAARAELKSLRQPNQQVFLHPRASGAAAATDPAFEYEKEEWKGATERSNEAKEQWQHTQPTHDVASETHSLMESETGSLPSVIKPAIEDWRARKQISQNRGGKAAPVVPSIPTLTRTSKDIKNGVAQLKARLAASLAKAEAANKVLSISSGGMNKYASASSASFKVGNGMPQYNPKNDADITKNGGYYPQAGVLIPINPTTRYSSNLPATRAGTQQYRPQQPIVDTQQLRSGRTLQYVPQSSGTSGEGGVVVNINVGSGTSLSTSSAGINVGSAPHRRRQFPAKRRTRRVPGSRQPWRPGARAKGARRDWEINKLKRRLRTTRSDTENEQYHIAVQNELQKMVSQTVKKNKQLEAELKIKRVPAAATAALKAKLQKEVSITKLAEQNEDAYQEMEIHHLQKQVRRAAAKKAAADKAAKAAVDNAVADKKGAEKAAVANAAAVLKTRAKLWKR